MLRHLRVTNFAILSDVEIELGAGMNVLTGETGAGKSLIVEAVNLLRGGRASADIPRAGAEEAVVEAVVEIPDDLRARVASVLEAGGLPPSVPRERPEDDEVFIRRVIQRGGRSRTYVNGALTTAARLAELGALLIDLSGQHQHQGLVDPVRHLEILDGYCALTPGATRAAKVDHEALVAAMAAAWRELRRLDEERAALGGDERQRAARMDYLRYQLEELDAAGFQPGEDAAIELERTRLASVDQLQHAARAACELLDGDDGGRSSARDQVAAAAREVERATRNDPGLAAIASQLSEIAGAIDDAAEQLRSYADRLEGDPERLAYLDDRLALVRRVIRKHARQPGDGLDHVLAVAAELRAELEALAERDERLAAIDATHRAAEAAAVAAASSLTQSRTKAARRLEKEVTGALAELGMASARLSVLVEPRALGPAGADRLEMMLASNKGEDARPLARIASGGELSRIMLALKLALRRADEVATYVFDEVDAGIGGATAQAVGSQIRAVASVHAGQPGRQVLCVTHLAQIAAFADHHFHVQKSEVNGRTETHVQKLGAAARKDELARMLGGQATTKARAHAAELLAEAARPATGKASSARPG
ncbi:MAG: DNA repair protein RecN [Deltaproteobacteria bacterium]|nr:DNA repair protein RecN [Deltaproteobacteria bacterium]